VEPKDPKHADLNVRLPKDLVEKLKDYSWTVNRPLTKIVAEALEKFLAEKKIKPRPKPEE
jgi:predicted DNA-binding protein